MYKFLLSLIVFCLVTAVAAPPKKSSGSSKRPTVSKSNSKQKHGRTARRTSSRGQASPTASRYREIQQALADRGYLKTEPNGIWGTESIEALKRFQEDQKLRASGKLDPQSLISLGLGPKRQTPSNEKTAEP